MAQPPKTAAFVSHSAELAGAERSLLEHARSLQDVRIQVIVVVPKRGPLVAKLKDLGIRCLRIRYPWLMRAKPCSALEFRARQMFSRLVAKTLSFDQSLRAANVIISNTAVISAGYHLAQFLNVRHYWLLHELPSQFQEHARMLNFISETGSQLIANSYYTIEQWRQASDQLLNLDVDPLYPPVHPPQLEFIPQPPPEPSPSATLNLATIGRLCPEKRQTAVIHLAHAFTAFYGRINIILVGPADPAYQAELVRMTRRVNNEKLTLTMLPWHPTPFAQIPPDSLVVQPSTSETFGRVLIEAHHAGFLTLSCFSPAQEELLGAQREYTIAVNDVEHPQLEAIRKQLADPGWKSKAIRNAQKCVAAFSQKQQLLSRFK